MTNKILNPENDYTLDEIKKFKWNSSCGFEHGVRKYWLGEFDGDSHIAYNQVLISQFVKSSYGFKEVKFKVEINADYYGECGQTFELNNIGLREVKKEVLKVISESYSKNKWFLKKRNLQ